MIPVYWEVFTSILGGTWMLLLSGLRICVLVHQVCAIERYQYTGRSRYQYTGRSRYQYTGRHWYVNVIDAVHF